MPPNASGNRPPRGARLRTEALETRRRAYAHDLPVIEAAWDAKRLDRMGELLDRQRPRPGQDDVRGFEWHYFERLRRQATSPALWSQAVERLTMVDVAPDGKTVVSAAFDGRIQLWDAATGQLRTSYRAHVSQWAQARFARQGNALVLWGGSGKLRVLDLSTDQSRDLVFEGVESIMDVAVSRDGKWLAAGSGLSQGRPVVQLWEADGGKGGRRLVGPNGAGVAFRLSFTADGKGMVVQTSHQVLVWDLESSDPPREMVEPHPQAWNLALSPDGKLLASAGSDHVIRLREIGTGKEVTALAGHTGQVHSLIFTPDGRGLVSQSLDNSVRIWDLTRKSLGNPIYTDVQEPPGRLALSGDGRTLFSAGGKGVLCWRLQAPALPRTLTGSAFPVWALAFSPDGRTLVSGGDDGIVRSWDAVADRLRTASAWQWTTISTAAFTADGTLVTGDLRGRIKLWTADGRERRAWSIQAAHGVRGMAVSPDGQLLATAGDTHVKLWELATGRLRATLSGHTEYAMAVAFSPDGGTVVSAGDDNTLKLWNAGLRGEHLAAAARRTLSCPRSTRSLAFDRAGLLVSGDTRGALRWWDPVTGQQRRLATGHTDEVRALALAPDGRTLASASQDGSVKLWQTATGELLATLRGHADKVIAVAFAPDGQILATGGTDGVIRLWAAR